MSATLQLDLFAPPVETVVVEPAREVIRRGASAGSVPSHEYVPEPRPRSMHTDEEWLGALSTAEGLIRWKSWTQPHPLPLDERPHECVGGGGDYWHDGKGVAAGAWNDRRYATWPALLKGLQAQREHEPHIADARDLAHAYHALEQYDGFYVRDGGSVAGHGDSDEWRQRVAVPHLAHLKQVVVDLGGDPGMVERL